MPGRPQRITKKNRDVIDLYLAEGPMKGKQGECWAAVYGVSTSDGSSRFSRIMKRNPLFAAELTKRHEEINKVRVAIMAYDRAEYMRDLQKILDAAMSEDEDGNMASMKDALAAAKALYAEEKGQTFPAVKVDHTHRLQQPDEIIDVSDIMSKFTRKPIASTAVAIPEIPEKGN